ncbi:hypothetical protein PI23P_11002 [Polaribacter irgensii 23-P]|uniref:Uncharacterized protein n=1 Tax=Polaribacter irgensii 23-P TaxID=313594 RepID=A4C153_9FLAO|nr:hypothetical protein PI23P_11002 [Polaribacter irgensii 23-P]
MGESSFTLTKLQVLTAVKAVCDFSAKHFFKMQQEYMFKIVKWLIAVKETDLHQHNYYLSICKPI